MVHWWPALDRSGSARGLALSTLTPCTVRLFPGKSIPYPLSIRNPKFHVFLYCYRRAINGKHAIAITRLLKLSVLNALLLSGKFCELEDFCASKPCRNGATCNSLEDSYRCECAPGFVGLTCSEDVVECRDDPCAHGSCKNTHGSYKLVTMFFLIILFFHLWWINVLHEIYKSSVPLCVLKWSRFSLQDPIKFNWIRRAGF